MQAFTMTFLAEWGDRSQLTTIILGAREDAFGVITGEELQCILLVFDVSFATQQG